jgi:hypothetical protein
MALNDASGAEQDYLHGDGRGAHVGHLLPPPRHPEVRRSAWHPGEEPQKSDTLYELLNIFQPNVSL